MFNNIPPITKNLILLNIIVYAIANFVPALHLYDILPAYLPESPNFRSYQIVTHMFMHAQMGDGIGIAHIMFNMFTLWSFGPVLEQTLKEKRYLILYFLSGLGAFLLQTGYTYFQVQNLYSDLNAVQSQITADLFLRKQEILTDSVNKYNMLGASGAIFGVVAAFATLFPEAKLMFMFIPFPIKAKILFPIVIIVSILLGFWGLGGGIAHFAHIGGALVGYILAKMWKRGLYKFN